MIAGKKYVGPLADIWSMGVILFALVCGFLPFEDANTSVLYKKILSGEYKTPKWISPEVKDLIRRILETDPRKRYTMADIRKHPWYTMVAEKDIPKEIVNVYEDEQTRAETLTQLASAGVDTQALMDGLASHACNSLTALYYLSEQKFRARRANQQKQHGNEEAIPQTRSDLTNKSAPETQEVPATQHPPQPIASVAVKPSPLFGGAPAPSQPQANSALKPLPTNPVAVNGVTAYSQTPAVQQQPPINKGQQSATQTNAVMPSLDYYMRTGLSIPIGNSGAPGNAPLNVGSNDSNSAKLKPVLFAPKVVPGASAIADIPKLNLNKPKPTIPPLQKPSSSAQPGNETLISQTARGPIPTVKITPIVAGSSNVNVPQSARAVLSGDTGAIAANFPGNVQPNTNPIDMGYEVDGRPGTRRSRGRSRGAGNEGGGFDGPPQGLFDTVPHQQPQYQPPIRSEQVTLKEDELSVPSSSAVVTATSNGITASLPVAALDSTSTNDTDALIVASNEIALTVVTPVAPASIKPSAAAAQVAKAPDAAPRSGSATQPGRRGKHLVVASNPAPSVQRTGSSSSKNSQIDSRQEAARNKLAAQGTFNISTR